MSLWMILLRTFFIFTLFSVFPGLVGFILFGITGAALGISFSSLGLVAFAFYSEKGMPKAYHAHLETSKGLSRSLALVGVEKQEKPPQVFIFPDPLPQLLVVRSLGGSGTLLMSQGLMVLLNEEELRAVLGRSLFHLQERGLVFQSFCSILAIWILGFAPRSWRGLIFGGRTLEGSEERNLGSISALGFLILFPVVRLLLKLSKPAKAQKKAAEWGSAYSKALKKISQSIAILGPSRRGAEVGLKTGLNLI